MAVHTGQPGSAIGKATNPQEAINMVFSLVLRADHSAYSVSQCVAVDAVVFARLTTQSAGFHSPRKMAKLHPRWLQFAVDLDAEQFARRDLYGLVPGPDYGPATARLNDQDAFLLRHGDRFPLRNKGHRVDALCN